ncbi:hypothetical protein WJX72_000116 [[Myrmecia] bisecta]|uniref:3-isopropylmalate dehydrogenase n=1 Tax=[Myrmecia] bisecta TaxID=41462 RepID=A0AAW1Q376_9CHLO
MPLALRVGGSSAARSRQACVTVCKAHKIAVLPGDGIGPEITKVALELLQAAGEAEGETFQFEEALIGGAAIDATGQPFPDETLQTCRNSDSVLLAAIGGYKWDTLPAAQRPERGLLALRSSLNAFANLRPAVVLPQLAHASTLKPEVVEGVDILIVRELVGGIYFGTPRGFTTNDKGEKVGYNTMVYSESEVERIAHVAFDAAMKRKKRLCSVEKSNVLEVSQLWREVVTRVAKQYPEVELSHMYIDNAAMQMIRNPKEFDTIVTGNLFGDILSDEASMLTGSLGMLPSASISGAGPGVYEPVHGSAPDIAGKDLANPMAMVLSAAMMCRYGLALPQVAAKLEAAVTAALDAGYRTGDLMSPGMKQVGTRGLILLNGLILLLASNWVVIKESQQHFDALVFGGLRFTVAGLAFSPFLKSAVADTELLLGGVELGVWSGLGYFTQALGLMTTDASRGSFISAFTVIVVPLLAGLSGKGVKPLTWASAIIALVGVGLLEQGGKAPNIGDAWGFASAVLFGIQVFRTEHFSRVLPQGSTLKLMSVIMATIAVMSASAALLLHPHETEHVLSHISSLPQMIADGHIPWMAIFYTGLLSTDVALWIEVIALHDVSSTDAAIIYTLEPVLGALFAYLVLDERWGPAGWVGAALIVFSSLATQLWGGDADGGAPNSAVEKVKTKNR